MPFLPRTRAMWIKLIFAHWLLLAQYTEYSQTKGLEYSEQPTWLDLHWRTRIAPLPVSFDIED